MKVAILSILLAIPFSVVAQDSLLFKLEVEEILKMPVVQEEEETVTTASKKSETTLAAPASMTVVTAKEIEALGANSLHEVLDRVTSLFASGSFLILEGSAIMRGTSSTFNLHTLVLLNGRPLREAYVNGGLKDIFNTFPIHSLEKIEIIRGSGSVLYGSNAYTCVINLITRQATENLHVYVSQTYGSFGTWQSRLGISKKKGNFSLGFYGKYLQTEGWQFTARGSTDMRLINGQEIALKDPTTLPLNKTIYSSVCKVDFKNFHAQYLFAQSNFTTMGTQSTAWNKHLTQSQNMEHYWDVSYAKTWQKLTLTANLDYILFRRNTFGGTTPNRLFAYNLGKAWLGELYMQFSPSEKLHFSWGGTWNHLQGKGQVVGRNANGFVFDWVNKENTEPFIPLQNNEVWYSTYFQADYQISKILKIDVGGQVNKAGASPINFVPRANLIANWQNKFFGKLIYGQAFRSPSLIERYNNTGIIHSAASIALVGGGDALNPETIRTIEAQIAYKHAKFQVSATYFNNFQHNLITNSTPADSLVIANAGEVGKKMAIPKQINRGNMRSSGVEIEGKTASLKNFYATFSLSMFERDQLNGLPKGMFKTGIIYDFIRYGLQAGLYNTYFEKGTTIQTIYKTANPEVTSFSFMTLNINWKLKKYYGGAASKPDIICSLYITNLLNEQIYYAENSLRIINSIPGRAGRAFYASLQYHFGR